LAVALADAEGEAAGLEDAEADGLASAEGDGDDDGDDESKADGDGDGVAAEATAEGLGSSDAGGVAGIAMMTPASTASATRTPATRPARTDSRGPISRESTSTSVRRRVSPAAARIPPPWQAC
jgi:hypothetical protein